MNVHTHIYTQINVTRLSGFLLCDQLYFIKSRHRKMKNEKINTITTIWTRFIINTLQFTVKSMVINLLIYIYILIYYENIYL